MDTSTGIEPNDGSDDDSDDEHKWHRSPSPSSSVVSHIAASFVQRVNAFVGGIAPKSPGGPLTDAEIEAEAERERDRSRREAEAILTKEAQKRKLVEERVLAMMESAKSLPPPPSRSQAASNPPSPSNSQKESSWWSAAKNKLTPTKEPLTPAQQVIIDAKARDKKGGKGKEKEWPSNAQGKFNDPAFTNLNIPVAPPQRRPVPSSPSSPTPSRPSLTNMPPNLTPSPMRATDSISSSPSREAPPLYAQFNAQGTLDVPGTLLAIAKRFEKLEKWTVGHVRALEDRMNDVEKWLVDKEKEKEEAASMKEETKEVPLQELKEMREEVLELQGRVGELGREMAKLATAPSNLSSGPKSQVTSVSISPQTISSVILQQSTGTTSPSTPHHPRLSSTTAVESTSPPMASTKTPSGTRLPYPQGDYTSPPDTFSPTNSPPGSINAAVRARPIPIPGLPISGSPSTPGLPSSTPGLNSSTSYSSVSSVSSISSFGGRALSPRTVNTSPSTTGNGSGTGLPPPKSVAQRQTSISPTPRKRYTVALGGPIVAPDELSSNAAEPPPRRVGTPKSFAKPQSSIDSTFFSSTSSSRGDMDGDDHAEYVDLGAEETIGKSAAARFITGGMGDYKVATPSPPMSNRRLRAQSAYGLSNILGSDTMASSGSTGSSSGMPSVAPLKPKLRSKSSERLNLVGGGGTGDGMVSALGGGAKFVDPLILRKQSRDSFKAIAMPKPIGKVPIGQLVAFFDGDKNNKS